MLRNVVFPPFFVGEENDESELSAQCRAGD